MENAGKMFQILPPKLRHNPAITDLIISIYTDLGKDDKAVEILDETIKFHQSSGDQSSENVITMLRRSARYKLDHGDPKSAAKLLEEITKQVPNDVAVIAELIGAYSTFDPQ